MICDNCGKDGARVRRVRHSCGRGDSEFLIENVPLVCCPHCGQSYFTAETLKEIERIQANWRELTVTKEFPVARFEGVA